MDRGVVSGRNRGDLTPLSCDNEAAAAATSARLIGGRAVRLSGHR